MVKTSVSLQTHRVVFEPSSSIFGKMSRVVPILAALALSACSTYQATVEAIDTTLDKTTDAFKTPPPQKLPEVDLSNAQWQKLTANQPESNPLRVAIVERNEKFGLTRAVIKAPPAFTLPPYWLTANGNYTVLKGTFVFDTVTADGKHRELVQGPGAFAEIPRNLIIQSMTRPGPEALIQITVYGEWSPKVADGAWSQKTAHN
jgi:hypothetical protein